MKYLSSISSDFREVVADVWLNWNQNQNLESCNILRIYKPAKPFVMLSPFSTELQQKCCTKKVWYRTNRMFSLNKWLHKTCENTSFNWPVSFRTKIESTALSLYGRIRVSQNSYAHIFCAVNTLQEYIRLYFFNNLL